MSYRLLIRGSSSPPPPAAPVATVALGEWRREVSPTGAVRELIRNASVRRVPPQKRSGCRRPGAAIDGHCGVPAAAPEGEQLTVSVQTNWSTDRTIASCDLSAHLRPVSAPWKKEAPSKAIAAAVYSKAILNCQDKFASLSMGCGDTATRTLFRPAPASYSVGPIPGLRYRALPSSPRRVSRPPPSSVYCG
jgi:hypothetical protein